MEIHIKTFMALKGINANDALISARNIRRKQERKFAKKFVKQLTKKEIKLIAKVHPVGNIEVTNLS
jgi:hypothetical protein